LQAEQNLCFLVSLSGDPQKLHFLIFVSVFAFSAYFIESSNYFTCSNQAIPA
jgi:hypothetical protein